MQRHSTSKNGIERVDFNEVFASGSDADKQTAEALLAKIHAGIYCSTFPIPSEQEALEDWVERLHKGKAHAPRQFFTAYGRNLDDPEHAEIIGFIVSEYYNGTRTGLFNYVLREKQYSDEFPAKEMCDHHLALMKGACKEIDGKTLKGALWEANDPQHEDFKNGAWRENDCMDPAKRCSHIEKNFGARRLGLNYAQSPLGEYDSKDEREEMTCDALRLYLYDADHSPDFNAHDLRAFMHRFRESFSGAKHPEDHLDVDALKKMDAQLGVMEAFGIPVRADKQNYTHRIHIDRAHQHRDGTHAGAVRAREDAGQTSGQSL